MDESRKLFSSIRAQGYAQVKVLRVCNVVVILQELVDSALCIFRLGKLRRNVNLPVRKLLIDCLNPLGYSSLSRIDFLTATYKANNRSPVLALIQRPYKERRLGNREILNLLLIAVCSASFEIVGKSLVRPGALRFIENSNVLDFTKSGIRHFYSLCRVNFKDAAFRRVLYLRKHIVTIAVNHLDRLAYLAARVGQFLFLALLTASLIVVLCQSLSQHRNKRAVAGQINCALILYRLVLSLIRLPYCYVEANKCFASSRDAGHKANTLLPLFLARFNNVKINTDIDAEFVILSGYFDQIPGRGILQPNVIDFRYFQ